MSEKDLGQRPESPLHFIDSNFHEDFSLLWSLAYGYLLKRYTIIFEFSSNVYDFVDSDRNPFHSSRLYTLSILGKETDKESESDLLENIHNALLRESVTTEIMVGLLTLLCVILTTLVVYLCYTRGIASLSRYVM